MVVDVAVAEHVKHVCMIESVFDNDTEAWRDLETRICSEEAERYLDLVNQIGHDDVSALRRARTYRFKVIKPKPEYL